MDLYGKLRFCILCITSVGIIIGIGIAFFLKDVEFRPLDFGKFRPTQIAVFDSAETRLLTFYEPPDLEYMRNEFFQLKRKSSDYSRLNNIIYYMTVYFEDRDPLVIYFYNNHDLGKIISVTNVAYTNDNLWTKLDSLFQIPEKDTQLSPSWINENSDIGRRTKEHTVH